MDGVPPIEIMLAHEDERKIILHEEYHDPWSWDDFYAALDQERAITRTANGRTVYRVVDLRGTTFVPPGAIQHFRRASERLVQNPSPFGMTVYVTTDPFVRALGNLLRSRFPQAGRNIRRAATLPEAYLLIQRLSRDEAF
jgi:hypothetical protein